MTTNTHCLSSTYAHQGYDMLATYMTIYILIEFPAYDGIYKSYIRHTSSVYIINVILYICTVNLRKKRNDRIRYCSFPPLVAHLFHMRCDGQLENPTMRNHRWILSKVRWHKKYTKIPTACSKISILSPHPPCETCGKLLPFMLLYIRVPSAFINSNSIVQSTQIIIPQQLSTANFTRPFHLSQQTNQQTMFLATLQGTVICHKGIGIVVPNELKSQAAAFQK